MTAHREAEIEETPFFLSTGDLMAALLMIFVLLLAATLLRLVNESENTVAVSETRRSESEAFKALSGRYEQLVLTYDQLQKRLYEALYAKFKKDLPRWSAEIDPERLSITFEEPEVLFEQGQATVSGRFQEILDDFFPRYMEVLSSPEFRDSIEEIRIEGHTSSEWSLSGDESRAYFLNMELSQNRTRNVLEYALSTLHTKPEEVEWATSYITANGLSSSHLIKHNDIEDARASRRVEFRVRTNAEDQIARLLDIEKSHVAIPATR